MLSLTPSTILIFGWWMSYKVPVKATQCSAPSTITLVATTPGAVAATSNIFSTATLASALKDLPWMPAKTALIFLRTRRSRSLLLKKSITTILLALFWEHLHCAIQFLAHVLRPTPGPVSVRFSAEEKEMSSA